VSTKNLEKFVPANFTGRLIVTGFVATTTKGRQTTLGRNGSDFSGSIFGALLDASEIIIWTDVDGVLSADPRLVPNAQVIDQLSYNEAMELAYFGAKVIHPQTMEPAVARDIPIFIRNTFAPQKRGTLICANPVSAIKVKGITTIDPVALVNLEGAGMIGVPGTAHRLFGALRDSGISVILISQGSSEHSICFAIPESQAARAEESVRRAFEAELRGGQIQHVEITLGMGILAVVGDGMAGAHGVAAKVFNSLGDAAISVRAIAQGASERNISVVVDGAVSAKALRAVHAAFYLSPNTMSIGLIGPGTVGRVLLAQMATQIGRLRDLNLDLRVRGIATSTRMLLAENSVDLDRWPERLAEDGEPLDLQKFVNHVQADYMPHTVIIDCTASQQIADHYRDWLAHGIHIVTPNKKANSGMMPYYRALQEARRAAGTHYLYEATVGAGLPVIQTLRDLRQTGDDVTQIEGIFSGTLAYLFNAFTGKESFSSIVRAAKAKGFTEPDPREDLSGMDVARKLIILAREMGLSLEIADVQVEGLVPQDLVQCSAEEFMERLSESDASMAAALAEATAKKQVLRYVGRIDAQGKATVGLRRLDATHAFANIALTDNVVRFATRRYCDNPLIVQGPGAGPEVTAGGVFSDLLRLSAYLGAHL
jgi:aspartokinase/homoserine dehydrogenase 1